MKKQAIGQLVDFPSLSIVQINFFAKEKQKEELNWKTIYEENLLVLLISSHNTDTNNHLATKLEGETWDEREGKERDEKF